MNTVAIVYNTLIIGAIIAIHAGLYKIFEKAGEKGWKALVPFLNYWVLLEITGKPKWWFIWAFIPIVNLVIPFLILIEIAKSFGHPGLGHQTLAMLFPYVYLPWLGFSKKERYEGPGAELYRNVKKPTWREWADAIVFALIAATFIRTFFVEAYKIPTASMEKTLLVGDHLFVSKFHYGARFPMTPIAFPLAHHTLPLLNTKAYVDWIQLPYYRLPGFTHVKAGDIVVFNFPAGDTVVKAQQEMSYYNLKRLRGGLDYKPDELTWRPVDKRENYVKRCVAAAGDTILIRDADIYLNGVLQPTPPMAQFAYRITTKLPLGNNFFEEYGLLRSDVSGPSQMPGHSGYMYLIHTTISNIERIKKLGFVKDVQRVTGEKRAEFKYNLLYPHDYEKYPWDLDNFGPVWVPKKGTTIPLNDETWLFYKRCMTAYEHNEVKRKDGKFFINGKEASEYTFEQNYYWMMGDNRHRSLDSRYWGFVPEDHVVGTPWFIWFSTDPDKSGLIESIRWNRIMKFVR